MQAAHGTAVLFVTHDLGVVAQVCDSVTLLFGGKVIEEGAVADVLEAPRADYTRALLDACPRSDAPAFGPAADPARADRPIASRGRGAMTDDLLVAENLEVAFGRGAEGASRFCLGSRCASSAARPSALSAKAAPARRRSAARCCGSSMSPRVASSSTGAKSHGLPSRKCGRCDGACSSSSRTRWRRSIRATPSAGSSRRR